MCILSNVDLERRILLPSDDPHRIVFEPYDREIALQPASLDMRLNSKLIVKSAGGFYEWYLEKDGPFWMEQFQCVLGTTYEVLGVPDDLAMQMGGKSSIGRNFVLIHCTAGFHDPGFGITGGEPNESTLEIVNLSPDLFELRFGMPICQAEFSTLTSRAIPPYKGKYVNQRGPTADRTTSFVLPPPHLHP